MEEVLSAVIAKLDASSLLLVIVLFGGWKLGTQLIVAFKEHAAQVAESLKAMAEDAHALRLDMSRIAEKVAVHEVRLDSLERQRD